MNINHLSGLLAHTLTRNSDCSNNGVTTKHNQFLLIDPDNPKLGPIKVTETCESNILIVSRTSLFGREYVFARPIGESGQIIDAMVGGNFVYSSDSRYRRTVAPYPIAVHDRIEH